MVCFPHFLYLSAVHLAYVTAFPNGAPPEACDTLSPSAPEHGAGPSDCPQPCPFFMEVQEIIGIPGSTDSTEYFCGSLHRTFVSSRANSLTPFRGFFTQARESTPVFDPRSPFVGDFDNIFNDVLWQIRPCPMFETFILGAGATHTSNIDKFNVDVIWRAPPRQENPPNVTFWFTIVQRRTLYHIQMEGLVLTPNRASCQPTNTSVAILEDSITVSEGGTVSLCVILINAVGHILLDTLIVTLTTVDVTASIGSDYILLDETVTFVPGDTVNCVTVMTIDDTVIEEQESFLAVATSTSANVLQDTTVVSIADNDAASGLPVVVGLQLTQATVSEGDILECCVVIISGTAETEHVLLMGSAPFTALELDFVSFSQTVTFNIGDTVGARECVNVQIRNDDAMENDEVFFIYVILYGSASSQDIEIEFNQILKRVTIIDQSTPNVIVGFQRTDIRVNEDGGLEVVCAVILSNQTLTQDVEVTIISTDDTAISSNPGPVDFISLLANVRFLSGSRNGDRQCVCITILDDDLPEDIEQFTLSLIGSPPAVTTVNDTATVSIIDTSANTTFGFTTTDVRVREGQDTFVHICIIQLSAGPLMEPITLQLTFIDKEATQPDDYNPQAGTVTFGINAMEGDIECVRVNIENDEFVEEIETFSVILRTDLYVEFEIEESLSYLMVTIVDDDGACIGLTSSNLTVGEEDEEVFTCVELLKPLILSNESSFEVFTRDGTALAGDDYVSQSRTCRFPSGSVAGDKQCLSIPIIDNSVPDGDREFMAMVSTFDPLVRVEPGLNSLSVLIIDNDLPQLRLQESEYTVTEDNGTVNVCAELVGGPLTTSATALLSTQSQSAVAGRDFGPLMNQLVTFRPGSDDGDSACVAVAIIDDGLVETTQTFTVRLVELSASVTVPADGEKATVEILDDDVSTNLTILFKEKSMTVREDSIEPAMVCIQVCPGNQSISESNTMNTETNVRFEFTTKPGSADDMEDFIPSDTSFSISSDLSQKSQMCAAVTVNYDNQLEGDEDFSVCLSDIPPANCVIVEGGESVDITIEDNEVPAVGFQLVESAINESYPDKFACVEIMFSQGPLESDVEIEFYTQDGSARAPDDYITLITTLTLREGTDGSRARDAACVSVFIIDDDLPEETETLSFHIRSQNTSAVRIMEGFESSTIHIIDNDVLNVSLDKPSYSVMENVGEGDLGLRVCATVFEATYEFTVLLIPQDGSARETVDYRVGPGRMEFFEIPGEQTRCICIEIVDDSNCTGNRTFSLTLYPLNEFITVPTEPVNVTIIEDDIDEAPLELRFIENSPRVIGFTVEANLIIGSKFCSATCSVSTREPVNCNSSSLVTFSDLPNRVRPFTFLVTAILCTGGSVNLTRRFRVGSGRCSAHLINDGVTVEGDCVTVEWQGTGPFIEEQIVEFTCSVDEGRFIPCVAFEGFTQCGLSEGPHELIVRPEIFEGCFRRIDLTVPFTVG